MASLRKLLVFLCLIASIIALFRFESARREENARKTVQKNAPEFFLEESLTTHYTADGKIEYQVNSGHLEYFRLDDRAEMKKAYFIFYNKDGLSWHSRSDYAMMHKKNDDILLRGNVRIWQPDRNLEITTDNLYMSDSRAIAETHDPIMMKSPYGYTKSMGMKIDLQNGMLQLQSGVNSYFNPVQRRAAKKFTSKKSSSTPKKSRGKT